MSASIAPPQPELLTSWKEIASYLGKGVRTVQRWEQQFGLPVRRPNEKVKGIVHATREDLDVWLRDQWSQRPPEMAHFDVAEEHMFIECVRASIVRSTELRRANQELLAVLQRSVTEMFGHCQTLARNMAGTPPGYPIT
jgi:phage terminase Nu1 subunit (DNA packaging protein)